MVIESSEGVGKEYWLKNRWFLSKNKVIDDYLTNWRWYAENNPNLQKDYVNFMIQETHLFMLLLKKGYDIQELTSAINYEKS